MPTLIKKMTPRDYEMLKLGEDVKDRLSREPNMPLYTVDNFPVPVLLSAYIMHLISCYYEVDDDYSRYDSRDRIAAFFKIPEAGYSEIDTILYNGHPIFEKHKEFLDKLSEIQCVLMEFCDLSKKYKTADK